jgi:hypothetical protein
MLILEYPIKSQGSRGLILQREPSREEQYQQLLAQTDPNSEFERVVLTAMFDRGLKLPDTAQMYIPEIPIPIAPNARK